MNDNLLCSICHEKIGKHRINLKCKHTFHIYCIYNWVYTYKKKSCPICRGECKEELDDKIIIIEKNENIELIKILIKSFMFTVIFFLFYLIYTFDLKYTCSISLSFGTSICTLLLIHYVFDYSNE